MSSDISKLPPPFPNAAQALNRVASDAQLRARVDQASENAPIRAGSEIAKSSSQDDVQADLQGNSNDNASLSAKSSGNSGKLDINV